MQTTDPRPNASLAGAIAATLIVLSGCATVQRDAAFGQVRSDLSRRLNAEAVWNTSAEQDGATQAAVERLLQTSLSPASAVQIALLNNRRLQATYEELGIAQADLVEAGLLANPVFSVTGLFAHGNGVEWDFDVVQDFVSVITLSLRKRIGQAAADRAAYRVSHAALDLARDVQAQYYTLVGDAQALELARQVVMGTEAAAELARRQFDAGNLSERGRSIQQGFYAQTLLDVAQAETQLAVDQERFNRLLGLWGAQAKWTIPERLPAVIGTLPSAPQLESVAIAQRFDLAARKKDAELTAQALALARRFRYLSAFGVGVAFQRDRDGLRSAGPVVTLGVPIFNQGQATIARLESEYARSEHEVAALAVEIRSQTREAVRRLAALHESVRYYEKALLPLQQTILSETLKFYNGMFIGAYDLLLAQQGQVQAGRQYIAALRDFWIQWSELERTVGANLPSALTKPTAHGAQPSSVPAPERPAQGGTSLHSEHGDKP